MPGPIVIQRIEGACIAAAAAAWFVHAGHAWWWLLALFLVVDLSAAGYLAGPRVGAATYNLAHALVLPLALLALGELANVAWASFAALVWLVHVGVDRALGYGLRQPGTFDQTHLGPIGRAREATREGRTDRHDL